MVDNSMQNMLDMYLYETNTMIEQLDEILLEAEKAEHFSSDDVNEIFRIMHTVKGSSAMMQFDTLTTVAHEVENLFFYIRENKPKEEFGRDLFNLLFKASDYIKNQVVQIENNEPLNDSIGDIATDVEKFLSQIKGEAPKSNSNDSSATDSESSSPNGNPLFAIRVFFEESTGMENLRSFMIVTALSDVCSDFTYEPADIETNNQTSVDIVEHGFLIYFNSQEDLDAAIGIVKSALNLRAYEVIDLKKEKLEKELEMQAILESEALELTAEPSPSLTAPADSSKVTAKKAEDVVSHISSGKQSLISVNLAKLDRLMDIVGEIVITESMVTSSPDLQGFKLDNFTKSARQLRKLTDDLQDTVMSVRMVPVSSVFQKMNRIVRDMCQALGKDVQLVAIGADTEVDKTIVDNIGDPIMHMVRNAMDHGIEDDVDARTATGKDPQGTITLEAQHTGSEVIITISDDGRGVNTAKVLSKAKAKGLLSKSEAEYTQREILQMILLPGFSTNDAVTEFSGRGVGMDVVKKNIDKVGGTVMISSEEGEGTTATLKIPLTLAIVDGMEISVGASIFTIPIHNICQSFKVTQEEVIYDATGGEMIRRMDDFYPLIRLHRFFGIESKSEDISDGIIIWVEADDKSYCLFIDELLGEQQVVVKPLPTYLSSYNIKDYGIAGCTILGDGNISIILDITNLYDAAIDIAY